MVRADSSLAYTLFGGAAFEIARCRAHRAQQRRQPVVLAWAHDTGADLAKTNVNGGAIAIGHPLGASGARIMTTLVNALVQRGGRYGLQTMCEGGGMANAIIFELAVK